jgi:hypothetical protein
MTNCDDPSLGPALHDLCASQPPQPVDRLEAVLRRARRIRAHRVGVGALAAIVMLGLTATAAAALVPSERTGPTVAASTTARPTTVPATTPTVPPMPTTPIADWPDRSLPAEQAVGNGALRTWIKLFNLGAPTTVHWLFRGTVQIGASVPTYVAAFLTPATGAGQHVVLLSMRRDLLDSAGNILPSNTGWNEQEFPPGTTDAISCYLAHSGGDTPDGVVPLHSQIFVLAPGTGHGPR